MGIISHTNGSRGTANARHFYYALFFVVTVLCRKLGCGVGCPLTGRYVFFQHQLVYRLVLGCYKGCTA
ncbi:hypothetical protein CIK04_31270 [Vibrio sp. 03_296]|nr:hypothetical protein CIK04_31270 [Vibrio sp. 03_296]